MGAMVKLFEMAVLSQKACLCGVSKLTSRYFWSKNCDTLLKSIHLSRLQNLKPITCRGLRMYRISDETVKQFVESVSKSGTEHAELQPLARLIHEKTNELTELNNLAAENDDLKEAAADDRKKILIELEQLEHQLFQAVLDEDIVDRNDVALEVQAGVGGQEAMLFAEDLFQMYENYASYCDYDWTLTSFEHAELGGLRRASANISGRGAYKRLKYEGGVHRVQRVPKTEKAGRIHTSTATVAILPVPTEIDVQVNPGDCIFEAKKASGAGGQHVNTTESAVRLIHKPSGIVVECQMERSQIRNRELALIMLRTKLYESKLKEREKNIRQSRKLQVGLSGRSEKIRTYNFPQDRVTDHRIGLTTQNLREVLAGERHFDSIVAQLQEYDKQEQLEEFFSISSKSRNMSTSDKKFSERKS